MAFRVTGSVARRCRAYVLTLREEVMTENVDHNKRRLLLAATTAAGGVAAAGAGAPFVLSLMPSERPRRPVRRFRSI